VTGRTGHGDAIVIGGGVIGLACAAELARRRVATTLIRGHDGAESSIAAAGMLAPGMHPPGAPAHSFGVAARDLYPAFVEELTEATGLPIPLDRRGILEIMSSEEQMDRRRSEAAEVPWLDQRALSALEPALAPALGALHHEHDGAVDNERLVRALEAYVGTRREIVTLSARASALELDGPHPIVLTSSGERLEASAVVLAAGAWASQLRGLPRPLPVRPVKGQMIALPAVPVRRVAYTSIGYFVPRMEGYTVVGATMEETGFDSSITRDAADELLAAASAFTPRFQGVGAFRQWSGLRPVTPDLLPILGPDPDAPSLLYAAGHSRNGILLAPVTALAVAERIVDENATYDLAPFAIGRFQSSSN